MGMGNSVRHLQDAGWVVRAGAAPARPASSVAEPGLVDSSLTAGLRNELGRAALRGHYVALTDAELRASSASGAL